jgi:hypothetical protein
VAVRTNEITLCDLTEYGFSIRPREHRADLVELVCARSVIPVHGNGMKSPPAIGARPAFLQAPSPHPPRLLPKPLLLDAKLSSSRVAGAVIVSATGLAPRLETPRPRPMEVVG